MDAKIAKVTQEDAKIAKRAKEDAGIAKVTKEDAKIAKIAKEDANCCACLLQAQEDLNESKRIYEDLHNELCTELPDFYNRWEFSALHYTMSHYTSPHSTSVHYMFY